MKVWQPDLFWNPNLTNLYKKIDLDWSNSEEAREPGTTASVLFERSGLEIIAKCIDECFGDEASRYYFEFSSVAGKTRYSDKVNDFIFLHGDWELKKFQDAFGKVLSFLQENDLMPYLHKEFFREPSGAKAICSISQSDADVTSHDEDDLMSRFNIYSPDTSQGKDTKIPEFQAISGRNNSWITALSVGIQDLDKNFTDREKDHNILIDRHKLCHCLYEKELNKTKKNTTEKAKSVLMSIPIVGSAMGHEYESLSGQGAVFVFVILNGADSNKGVINGLEKKIKELVKGISDTCKDMFLPYLHDSARIMVEEALTHAMKSSISAIMSRNMSHNIGSHVLARISGDKDTEGIWAKDVQVLSQYLQQRQDFIAQIATDWPKWTYPAWLMKDLMRWFLSQKHLLNYIGRSEGLEAHFYDSTVQKNPDMRFHVFRLSKRLWDKRIWDDTAWDNEPKSGIELWKDIIENPYSNGHETNATNPKHILLYTEKGQDSASCCLDEDIQLAIPGGITGYHAFYTILENVIRNGAKHSFTRMKRVKEDNQTEKDVYLKEKLKIAFGKDFSDLHMDVVIEYMAEDVNNQYRFRIYDNVSFVGNEHIPVKQSEDHLTLRNEGVINQFIQQDHDSLKKLKKRIDKEKTTSRFTITNWFKKCFSGEMQWNAIYPYPEKTICDIYSNLVVKMNNYFRRNVIDDKAQLMKGNWGLAEMKISSGYLSQKGIREIGAGRDNITYDKIAKLDQLTDRGSTHDDGFIIRATVSPIGTLAYEFRVPKPKEIGIVCNVKD